MATKSKQEVAENEAPKETWRKPLQVPPRANAMRSFYRGTDEETDKPNIPSDETKEQEAAAVRAEEKQAGKIEPKKQSQLASKKQGREAAESKTGTEQTIVKQGQASAAKATAPEVTPADKLTKENLSERLGIEIEDLFDVHELLRGKSFDIYQALLQSADENGRCKITQPELMKRTGIKNRRTFYKHEDWLINLNLLEKRHLPGDHKGVVYRVLEMSEVLPVSNEMLEKFKRGLENAEQ